MKDVLILAIDPGSRSTGLALYHTSKWPPVWGSIASGQRRSAKAQRLEDQAFALARSLGDLEAAMHSAVRSLPPAAGILLCVEGQRVYRGSSVDANDLIHLATIAGACVHWGLMQAELLKLPADLLVPEPSAWKAQASKRAHHISTLRALQIPYRALTATVVAPEGLFEAPGVVQALDWQDLMDAVCLGDWARSRLITGLHESWCGLLVQGGARALRWHSGPFPA